MEKDREEFEEWVQTASDLGIETRYDGIDGVIYLDPKVHNAWEAWQKRQPEIDALKSDNAELIEARELIALLNEVPGEVGRLLTAAPTPPAPVLTVKDSLTVAARNLLNEMRLHPMSHPEKELDQLEKALLPTPESSTCKQSLQAPTPPAREDDLVAYIDPLYTRSANDKLRKAAEALTHYMEQVGRDFSLDALDHLHKNLRAALEGK